MARDPLRLIETLALEPGERVMANYYANRMGRWTSNADASDNYYSGARRTEHDAVKVLVSRLKKKLATAGLTIEASGFRRRMMWLT